MGTRLIVSATGTASVARVWRLLAAPACWPAWAPHMTHVSSTGSPDAPSGVHVGQRLQVHSLLPRVTVPVTVTAVEQGRRWDMVADLGVARLHSAHTVDRMLDTTTLTVTLRWDGPRPVGMAVLAAYRPVATMALRRLLRLAEADARGEAANVARMCHVPPGDTG